MTPSPTERWHFVLTDVSITAAFPNEDHHGKGVLLASHHGLPELGQCLPNHTRRNMNALTILKQISYTEKYHRAWRHNTDVASIHNLDRCAQRVCDSNAVPLHEVMGDAH